MNLFPRCRALAAFWLLLGLLPCACSTVPIVGEQSAATLSAEALHTAGRQRFDAKDYRGAAELLEFVLERHYDYAERESVRYLAAEAWFAAGELVDAFEHYRRLLTEAPLSPRAPDIARRVWQIGAELATRPAPLLGDFAAEHDVGVDALNFLVTTFPKSAYADDGWKLLADAFIADHHPEGAAEIYERLIRDYPDSEWVDLAMFRAAGTYADLTRGRRYDIDPLLWAHAALRRYLVAFADGNFATQARAQLAALEEEVSHRELELAAYYAERGSTPGMTLHLNNAANRFPDAAAARAARDRLAALQAPASLDSLDVLRPRGDRPVWRRSALDGG